MALMIRQVDWNPEVMPRMEISSSYLQEMAEELESFHKEFSRCYRRREQHRLGLAYLRGLMSSLERKTAEGIALLLLDAVSVLVSATLSGHQPERFLTWCASPEQCAGLVHVRVLRRMHAAGAPNAPQETFLDRVRLVVNVRRTSPISSPASGRPES